MQIIKDILTRDSLLGVAMSFFWTHYRGRFAISTLSEKNEQEALMINKYSLVACFSCSHVKFRFYTALLSTVYP